MAHPPGDHVFKATGTIFKLIKDITKTNLLTKFHDGAINVASREKCPAPGNHVFQQTKTIFELIQDIIKTRNGAAEADAYPHAACLTRGRPRVGNGAIHKGQYQFEVNRSRNEEVNTDRRTDRRKFQDSRWTDGQMAEITFQGSSANSFHKDWKINVKNAPPTGGHVFQPTRTIFELIKNIIGSNLLTKFHED
ncbi:hypothetical protein DPMN_109368 [Dreissena polymorpha]|uniref:Uncharacterized protein n=1 Tax=Dreissena polymorpha TaxID=45954 RepID=A0A9D4KAM8_DREPO|nr:hypothetical protein DPMN_109368 [Dreissena polymorpha]